MIFYRYCGGGYLISKFWWLILIVIILAIVTYPEMNKEYIDNGYSGYWDARFDEWTGEIIPKQELETYNNDDKYITNSKGEQIKFAQIDELLNKYEEIQGDASNIKKTNLNKLTEICDILIKEYFDLDYEVCDYANDPSTNMYSIRMKGEFEDSEYKDVSSASYLRSLAHKVVKEKYRSQNGLDEKK